jgi:hypothetical protein
LVFENKSDKNNSILKSGKLYIKSFENLFYKFQHIITSFEFEISAKNLPISDLFSSDPYFKIFSINENKKILVYQSEKYMKNLNPTFQKFILNINDCNNYFNDLIIQFYDFDKIGNDDEICNCNTTLQELILFPTEIILNNNYSRLCINNVKENYLNFKDLNEEIKILIDE